MTGKSNKLYVIVDEEEGILLINMDREDPDRKLLAATLTLAEAGDLNKLMGDALLAIDFVTEFDAHPLIELRKNLKAVFDFVKFRPDSGLKYCIGIEQTKAELATARRKSTYTDINDELDVVAGPSN